MPCALPAGVEDAGHARLTGDVLAPELVHHAVAVALEQRHERLHVGEGAALLVAGEQRDQAAVVERVAPAAELLRGAGQRLHEPAGVGIDRRQRALDQRQEVGLHPGHAGELRPVGDLVDRDPEPEVAGPEREALLQREDVAADVVDGVGGGVVVEHEQVVLAEHPLGEVPEEHPGLGARDPTADGRDPAAGHALADPRGERREQAAHRRDVGRRPTTAAVDDLGPCRARRPQAGVVGDELLGLGGDGVEVVAQRAGRGRRRRGARGR